MTFPQFLVQLGIVCISTTIILSIFHFAFPPLLPYENFSWICLAAFMIYSVSLFILAKSTSASENKNLFTGVMMLSSLSKILFSIILVLVYSKMTQPQSSWFLLPFFTNYLIFTILEVNFMSKVGRVSPQKTSNTNQ